MKPFARGFSRKSPLDLPLNRHAEYDTKRSSPVSPCYDRLRNIDLRQTTTVPSSSYKQCPRKVRTKEVWDPGKESSWDYPVGFRSPSSLLLVNFYV